MSLYSISQDNEIKENEVNTISKRAVTHEEAQDSMEQGILKECSAQVKVAMMDGNIWLMRGKPDHVFRAIESLEKTKLAKEFGERLTLEGDLFICFKTGA